ncbi:MAG: prolipoprotein diacylglyceryl transferase [Bacteroidia bacterium]
MHPVLVQWGSFTLYSYGFMIMVGVLVAFALVYRNRAALGLDLDGVSELFLVCFLGVFVGGKVFFFMENPAYHWAHMADFMSNLGRGFVFYGSFLFTVAMLWVWFRKRHIGLAKGFDWVGIGGACVHAFGKIGCFLSGCCHGLVCEPAYGVVYSDPRSSAEPLGQPLYPVQLWDSALIFVCLALMFWAKRKQKFDGQLFLIYAWVYGLGRFFTEMYRGDEARGYIIDKWLTHSQFIALLILLPVSVLYLRGLRAGQRKEEQLA